MADTGRSDENRYRLLLDTIAEELTHGDVDDLVFLLRFHIEGKRNRISINGDPRKLLTKLQKQNYIGVNNLALLLEVFDLIGRNDLIQKIKRYDCNITSENCQISPFIRDLWKFGQKLDESEDLKNSAFSLGWDEEKEEIKKAQQLFEKAFERGNLEKDEYNKLKEFAKAISQTKILESVMENGAKKSSQGYQNIQDSHNKKILDNEGIKASEDFPREGERSDSQKEPSEEIHLAVQNVAANTEQRSNTVQSSIDQPDPNDSLTGELRQSSNMVESAHPIDSAMNSDKSSYDGDKRDGQDADVTGKDKITPLIAVGNEKHEEDETKQGSVETKDRLPQQKLHESKLTCAALSTSQEQTFVIPRNPRCGRIISLKLDDMKKMKGDYVGEGSFGTVYKAKMPVGDDRKFAIKLINVSSEGFQKSYEKEIFNGRILHPFINPIIARAEDLSERVVYLMYPYMENLDLRHNIDLENGGNYLRKEKEESNSQIWTRCIYQIAHAVDYLHNPVKNSYRGPVFHQDLTSRNILLDGHFNAKIGDFGMAVEANKNATSATLSKEKEPHDYHPPGMKPLKYTASYDIFSVGVVMLEILTGQKTKLKEKPKYLYEKYVCEGGYDDLIHDLNKRTIQSAIWVNKKRRDDLAKLALEAVNQDDDQRKRVNLLQTLDEMKLNKKERYQRPSNLDTCVSCCINPPGFVCKIEHSIRLLYSFSCGWKSSAKLSLKGKDCEGNANESSCRPFCTPCLMNNHINPLVCPQHGKTRPPFGDHVYGVFVAGNNVMGMDQFSNGQSQNTKALAQTFIKDAEKVVQVLTTKYPFVLGASAEHLKIVKANKPGYDDNMETSIREAFENINITINKALKDNNQNPDKDMLQNSLFIFYFSGHCSEEKGLYLGNVKETLKASMKGVQSKTQKATTKFIMDMLHKNLRVDNVLVILDCCHASSQHFDKYDEENVDKVLQLSSCDKKEKSVVKPEGKYDEENVDKVLQLSSCDKKEKSVVKPEGSPFTSFLCLGLQGMDSLELGSDKIICCTECKKKQKDRNDMNIQLPCVKYHFDCVSDNGVTYTCLKDFIEGHFDLLRADKTSNSVTMTQVSSAQGEKKLYIVYYNPNKSHIPIHLKGSKANHVYCISSHLESMDKLRKDIISYTLSGTGDKSCDVLTFHKSYDQESYSLIAIHVMYGKDKYEELRSLESIQKAWSCSHELVACVREDVERLSHGPVKLNNINRSMVLSSQINIDSESLKINQNYIEIATKKVTEAEKELRTVSQPESGLHEKLINEVLKTTQDIRRLKLLEEINRNVHVLRFYLYDDFSVLNIQ